MMWNIKRGVLNWFEDFVAYCDRCRCLEAGSCLFEVSTASGLGGVWVRPVRCRDHWSLIAGRTALADWRGVHFA